MATIETVASALEAILLNDYTTELQTVQASTDDGLELEPIRVVEWEENLRDAIPVTPAALVIGQREADTSLRDMVRVVDMEVVFILSERDKRALTKKMYRYARALRQVLRAGFNRTLSGKVISAKVVEVDYGPTFTDDQLFVRGFKANIEVRLVQEND